jgi:hypothetical protein
MSPLRQHNRAVTPEGLVTCVHLAPPSSLNSKYDFGASLTYSRTVTSKDVPRSAIEQYWLVPGVPIAGIGTRSVLHDRPELVLRSMPAVNPLT